MKIAWLDHCALRGTTLVGPQDAALLFALYEESVLRVPAERLTREMAGLDRQTAVRFVSRCRQREALIGTGLNPPWQKYSFGPGGVVKAPASVENSGVAFIGRNPQIQDLARLDPEAARVGVIESYVEGDPLETDGFTIGSRVFFFPPVRQHWQGQKIAFYERVLGDLVEELHHHSVYALRALGARNTCFCLEWRRTHSGQLRLIEAQARLGYDFHLTPEWATDSPVEFVTELVRHLPREILQDTNPLTWEGDFS